MFLTDVRFVASKDPSLPSVENVLKTKTKSLLATLCYRIANFFYYTPLSALPTAQKRKSRDLMEDCLVATGIDIHPAARIGEAFFIDHGHGVVIGETCEIGKQCNIFNGVILGSKNVVKAKVGKRHPTLGNNVTICAGAKILGDITLGDNVFISPGAVVQQNVLPDQQVLIINQLQIIKNSTHAYLPSQKFTVYGIVPKFKNSFIVYGDGFYNPSIIIKLKNGSEINHTIAYWDKNKIVVKIKNTTPVEKGVAKNAKLIVLSNSSSVAIMHNVALEKTLTSLTI